MYFNAFSFELYVYTYIHNLTPVKYAAYSLFIQSSYGGANWIIRYQSYRLDLLNIDRQLLNPFFPLLNFCLILCK